MQACRLPYVENTHNLYIILWEVIPSDLNNNSLSDFLHSLDAHIKGVNI